MDMRQHVNLVGALHIGMSILGLLAAAIVFVATVGGGMVSGDPEAMRITALVGTLVAGFLSVLFVPGLIGGIGVLKRWSWARILVMVVSVFDLFVIPLGTALGIYSLWVLMHHDTEALFNAKS